jgi:small subunit ribosomal protein S6
LRHYELVTILSPMLNQDQAAETWGKIKDFITSREAEIVNEQSWGTRRLAYPIHKGAYNFLEGSYYLTQFSTERPFNQELHNFLRLDEQVIRSLIVATGPPAPPPPPRRVEPVAEAQAEAATPTAAAAPEAEAEPTASTEAAPTPAAAPAAEAEAEPVATAEPEAAVAVAEPEETVETPVAEASPEPEAAAETEGAQT